jgi:hypothetical protein
LEYDEQSDTRFEEGEKVPRPKYYFEVTCIPKSEAPLKHRKAFVGKVFPLMPRNMDGPEPMTGCGVESGRLVDVADAICVDIGQVERILRSAGEEQAADYWVSRNFPFLILRRSEVRIFLTYPSP